MYKYVLQEKLAAENNAGPKARNDVQQILKDFGFKSIVIHGFGTTKTEKNFIFRCYYHVLNILSVLFSMASIKWKSELVIQYYPLKIPLSKKTVIRLIYVMKLIKRLHIVALVHDLECIRFGSSTEEEIKSLDKFDSIIVHNLRMKDFLAKSGLKITKLYVLGFFDYLTNREEKVPNQLSFNVDFAGNLNKSLFLDEIKNIAGRVVFNLYGDCDNPSVLISKNTHYLGSFSSDEIAGKLSGSFGLVWDGSSIRTCSGAYGQYLKYNNPHKASLYIVAGIPLIVWADSALAEYVEQKKLGITIKSLSDIEGKISRLSNSDYAMMLEQINIEANRIRSGRNIIEALDKINSAI